MTFYPLLEFILEVRRRGDNYIYLEYSMRDLVGVLSFIHQRINKIPELNLERDDRFIGQGK